MFIGEACTHYGSHKGVGSTDQKRAVHVVLSNRYTKSQIELYMSLHRDSFSFRVVFVVLFCLWNDFPMSQ